MDKLEEAKNTVLSTNFRLHELLRSNTAQRLGIMDEQLSPPPFVLVNLTLLVMHVLQPLRTAMGMPIRVNSGYRCPTLNKHIGGSENSDHMRGQAVDISAISVGEEVNNRDLFIKILELDLPFKQLIWEFGDDVSPDWIHVSYDHEAAEKPRQQILRASKGKFGIEFLPYIKEDFLGGDAPQDESELIR